MGENDSACLHTGDGAVFYCSYHVKFTAQGQSVYFL